MLLLKNIAPESKGLTALAMSMVMVVVLTVNATGSSVADEADWGNVFSDAKDIKSLSKMEKVEAALDRYEEKTSLTDWELKDLLSKVGFEGAGLKKAWAAAKTESNGRPLAHNGNSKTGDNSYGIFQINMIGSLGDARKEKFDLQYHTDLFNPVVNAEIAYHMTKGGEDWSSWPNSVNSGNKRYVNFLNEYSSVTKEN